MDYVKEIFNAKFDFNGLGEPKVIEQNFNLYLQIKLPKITTSFVDVYYILSETSTDNGSFVKILLLVSKGYDNFITKESDENASQNILEMLNDLGVSVERKNLNIQIAKMEQDFFAEKQKIILLEEEIVAIENEKNVLDKKHLLKSEVLKKQNKVTKEMSKDLQKIKNTLSEFEKNITVKNKFVLKAGSRQ